jgi:hypothetical protein
VPPGDVQVTRLSFRVFSFSPVLLAFQMACPCAVAFRAQSVFPGRADPFLKGSYRCSGLSRFSSGTDLDVSHVAVRHIVTRVAVTNPPAMFDGVSAHWPFDSLGLNVMPGTPIICHPGYTTDDTKFTAQDLINLVNRGDIR